MNAKDLLRRYAVFTAGLYFLALGVVLIVRSQLGTTPISSANYVLSVNTPLTLGTWTTITNMLMIAAQLLLVRGCGTRRDVVEILMQAPFSLVFGLMIDLNMVLTAWVVPSHYVLMILTLLLGGVIQAFGMV